MVDSRILHSNLLNILINIFNIPFSIPDKQIVTILFNNTISSRTLNSTANVSAMWVH